MYQHTSSASLKQNRPGRHLPSVWLMPVPAQCLKRSDTSSGCPCTSRTHSLPSAAPRLSCCSSKPLHICQWPLPSPAAQVALAHTSDSTDCIYSLIPLKMTFCIFKLLLFPLLLLYNIQGQKARGCLAQTTIARWKFCLPVLLGYHNISNQSPREPQSPQEQNGQKELLSFSSSF